MGRLSTKFQKVGNFGLMDIFSYPSLNFACLVCSFILCSAYTKIDLLKTHIHLMMDFESTNIWCEKWNLIRFDREMNKIVIDAHYYHILCLLGLETKSLMENFQFLVKQLCRCEKKIFLGENYQFTLTKKHVLNRETHFNIFNWHTWRANPNRGYKVFRET